VIAILGGLGAALAWSGATLCSSRSTRMIGAWSVLSWVMVVGLAIVIVPVLAVGIPDGLDGGSLGWLALAGAGNVAGLLLAYSALRIGKVGIVAPILSTEGAVAALIAVAAGEHLSPGSGAMLCVIAAGVVAAGVSRDVEADALDEWSLGAFGLAVAAALAFGCSLYATGRVSTSLPIAWAILPARLIGTFAIAVPLAAARSLRLTRRSLPLVVAGGACEVAGFALFAVGARHGIAVSAVLASQFAAISAVAAYVLFRERLARLQLAGVVAIVCGVTVLTVLQA